LGHVSETNATVVGRRLTRRIPQSRRNGRPTEWHRHAKSINQS